MRVRKRMTGRRLEGKCDGVLLAEDKTFLKSYKYNQHSSGTSNYAPTSSHLNMMTVASASGIC